jgi:hypothetical protein
MNDAVPDEFIAAEVAAAQRRDPSGRSRQTRLKCPDLRLLPLLQVRLGGQLRFQPCEAPQVREPLDPKRPTLAGRWALAHAIRSSASSGNSSQSFAGRLRASQNGVQPAPGSAKATVCPSQAPEYGRASRSTRSHADCDSSSPYPFDSYPRRTSSWAQTPKPA